MQLSFQFSTFSDLIRVICHIIFTLQNPSLGIIILHIPSQIVYNTINNIKDYIDNLCLYKGLSLIYRLFSFYYR